MCIRDRAYTSTFAEVQVLRSMYRQAVSAANIVGLCVGTRPDCVPQAVLDLLSEYHQQGYEAVSYTHLAQARPAGPAPMIATVLPVGFTSERSGRQPISNALSLSLIHI